MKEPLVTILMPVYNTQKYVEQAVRSIIDQSFQDFELIIIDDGSTDQTPQILMQFRKNARIYGQERSGIVAALNRGLSLANGKYIARMDGDDVAMPERLDKQVMLLESCPDIGLVGSAVQVIDDSGRKWGVQSFEPNDIGIRWVSLLKNPFVHPSVLFRKSMLDRLSTGYRPLPHAEDYDLWIRLLRLAKGANIEQPLLLYRVHKSNVSVMHRKLQFESHYFISREAIRSELPDLQLSDLQLRKMLSFMVSSSREYSIMRHERADAIKSYLFLWQAFCNKHGLSPELKQVQSAVIQKSVAWILFPPFVPGINRIFKLLHEMDRGWLFVFLSGMPKIVSGFLRERLIWRF